MSTVRNLLLTFFLSLMVGGHLQAADMGPTKAKADSAYADRLYPQAIELYNDVLRLYPSAQVYYNLGNAHFRLRQYPQAVLAYERALHEHPGHEDARFNLELVRSRLTDRFSPPQRMFFVAWISDWVSTTRAQSWNSFGLLFLLFSGLSFGLYRADFTLRWRKMGFALLVFSLLSALFAFGCAYYQHSNQVNNHKAVVIAPTSTTYSSPNPTSKQGRVLHEGTTVEVLSSSLSDWLQVCLPDGTKTWLKGQDVEVVVNYEKKN